jgi:hypothetical protein
MFVPYRWWYNVCHVQYVAVGFSASSTFSMSLCGIYTRSAPHMKRRGFDSLADQSERKPAWIKIIVDAGACNPALWSFRDQFTF